MLDFKSIDINSLAEINKYLKYQIFKTCDFTIGGIYMWASYFKYEYAIYEHTLFIKGVSENDLSTVTFSVPVGKLSLSESLNILTEYCKKRCLKFIISAIPESEVNREEFKSSSLIKLENWSDYLYDIKSLSILKGRKYNRKRNHVNNFIKNNPFYIYERIGLDNILKVRVFFNKFKEKISKDNSTFINELIQTEYVLKEFEVFRQFFIGGLLKVDGEVIAFTIGEIVNDTLFIHIEKADVSYKGVYEMINMKFASDIMSSFTDVMYINREEDVGDEGLKKSKLSYNPIMLLNKYNIEVYD